MRHDRPVRLLAACALLAACGCGPEGMPVTPGGEDGVRAANGGLRCPDPNSCTLSNGTGVYFAEKGAAGLDEKLQLLITHFDNHEKYVTFEGRYFNPDLHTWQYLPTSGLIDTGLYAGDEWDVLALYEDASFARVVLQSRKDSTVVEVREKDMLSLTLRLRIENPLLRGKLSYYLLQFTAISFDGNIVTYMPEWRPDVYGSSFQPYCLDANGKPDSAVFQGGIQVDPVNGMVTRGADAEPSVTFSCRLGAPATCEFWGYDPIKLDWYFDGCIHMKRASYCGDASYYTYSGTKILLQDSEGVMIDKIDNKQIEAKWSPKGAACVTYPRHPALGFNFVCNGSPMPKCPDPVVNGDPMYLISGNP